MKLIIKYLFTLLVALGLGILVGWGYQKYEASTVEENFFADQWNDSMGSAERPIVTLVNGERIDFGTITENKSHEFIFKNDGTSLLEIWVEPGGVPIFAGIDLSGVQEDIPVGETYVVTVTASTQGLSEIELEDGKFSGEIVVRTTDPTTPKVYLQLSGKLGDISK